MKNNWLITLKGFLLIIFGLIALFLPDVTIVTLMMFFGIMAICSGIVILIHSLWIIRKHQHWGWWFIEGVLDIIIGLIVLAHPDVTAVIFIVVLGFWALFSGLIEIIRTINQAKVKNWWIRLINGIISVIFGCIFLIYPLEGEWIAGVIIGIYAILFGFFILTSSFTVLNKSTQE